MMNKERFTRRYKLYLFLLPAVISVSAAYLFFLNASNHNAPYEPQRSDDKKMVYIPFVVVEDSLWQPGKAGFKRKLRLALGASFPVGEIKLDFSALKAYPKGIKINVTDYRSDINNGGLLQLRNNTSAICYIKPNLDMAYLNIEWSDYLGRKTVLGDKVIQDIIRIAVPCEAWEEYRHNCALDKKIILKSDAQANPLRIVLRPITEYHKALAQKLLKNCAYKNDVDKLVIFMKYITKFKGSYAKDGGPSGTLMDKIGVCGAKSNALVALAAAIGIPARIVNLCNYPESCGHTVAECFIDEKWRVFDPTYALYYVNTKTREMMSFEDLHNTINVGVPIVFNKKAYEASGSQTGWGTQNAYIHANPSGPIGMEFPMYYHLEVDLAKSPLVYPRLSLMKYQGGTYIGAAMTNNNHVWKIFSLTKGKAYTFEIVPTAIGGTSDLKNFVLNYQLRSGSAKPVFGSFLIDKRKLNTLIIPFVASAPCAEIVLEHKYRGPQMHYVRTKSFAIKEVSEENSRRNKYIN